MHAAIATEAVVGVGWVPLLTFMRAVCLTGSMSAPAASTQLVKASGSFPTMLLRASSALAFCCSNSCRASKSSAPAQVKHGVLVFVAGFSNSHIVISKIPAALAFSCRKQLAEHQTAVHLNGQTLDRCCWCLPQPLVGMSLFPQGFISLGVLLLKQLPGIKQQCTCRNLCHC